MDTEGNQEAKCSAFSAWRKKRQAYPRKEIGGSSEEAGQARAAGKIGADIKEDEVNVEIRLHPLQT